MTLRFGTDGVRGVANAELTPELALALGRAAGRVLGADGVARRFLVGRDTRRSGPMLEAALAAGLASQGVDVELLGVVPTPTVAFAAQVAGVAGAMISASHNPFADNGIKLFAAGGRKLTDDAEAEVEHALTAVLAGGGDRPTGAGVGSVMAADPAVVAAYEDHVVRSIADTAATTAGAGRGPLEGMRLVVDGANGSASVIGPRVLRRLGADVQVLGDAPDGCNINDRCGATHTDGLQAAVAAAGADAGLAFDGDADRLIAVDGSGAVVDGDHIIAICAIDRHERGVLTADTVVVTVMTNLGFRLRMTERGIRVHETAVGDRYVLEALDGLGLSLGGEQSGHVIFPDLATTGDGLLTAVQLLDVVRRTGRPLAALSAAAMTRLPQVLRNVRVAAPIPDLAARLAERIDGHAVRLDGRGRILVRPSGTEPLVRVMVEAATAEEADAVALDIVAAVEALGAVSS